MKECVWLMRKGLREEKRGSEQQERNVTVIRNGTDVVMIGMWKGEGKGLW